MQSCFHVPGASGSTLKGIVVSSYFLQWAKLVVPHAKKVGNKLGFLDFNSGSGKNEDGSEAAPLSILKSAIESEQICNMLVSVFCDKESKNNIKLRQFVASIDGVEKLAIQPQLEKGTSCDDLINVMQKVRLLPSLLVLDAISIKDFNLESFSAYIKEGNFDCIFHIQYTLLEKMIDNPFKAKYLERIFGKSAADQLRIVSDRLNAEQKKSLIIKTFVSGLKSIKGFHNVLITCKPGSETNCILFVTRYIPRYRLMKEVMIQNGYMETSTGLHEPGVTVKRNLSVQAGLFN